MKWVLSLLLVLLVPFVSAQTVTVDSTYYGYDSGNVDDGIIDAFGGGATNWASESSGNPHWVQFDWGFSQTISGVEIFWEWHDGLGAYTTSQEVQVQYWDGSSWVTVSTISDSSNVSSSQATFAEVSAARWRLLQSGLMGPVGYATTFRVSEVDWVVGSCVVDGDLNEDCVVDISDVLIVAQNLGRTSDFGSADRNGDGVVNVFDLVLVARYFGSGSEGQSPSDTTAPVRSGGSPSGTLSSGTTSATLGLSTDEVATCVFSDSSGALYSDMGEMSSTGGTSHSHRVTGLVDGGDYAYYVKCRDGGGNTNSDDFVISFSVDSSSSSPPSGVLFHDDFETYGVDTRDHEGESVNGFTWGGGRYVEVSDVVSRSGSRSLRFDYGPYEPNGDTHMWAEQRFNLGSGVQELWIEHYTYFPDGTEGSGVRYVHEDPADRSWNIKFLSIWADTYFGEPLGLFQLWPTRDDIQGSTVNVGITYGDRDGDSDLIRYPTDDGTNGGVYVGSGDRGRWIQSRIHLRVADLDQANGVLQMWKDEVNIVNVTGITWFDEGRFNNYLLNGYFFGYDNQHFSQNTSLFIDDVTFYTENPDWGSSSDTVAPVRSSGAPSGTLASGTTNATLSLSTDENSTCAFSMSGGVSYSRMSQMSTTDGTSHSQSVSVSDGQSYTYHIRCQDSSGNTNSDDYTISFNVASSSSTSNGTPFFEDSFESGDLSSTQNGFTWNSEYPPYKEVTNERAFSGSNSLKFHYTEGSSPEARFSLGNQYQELWVEWYVWVPSDWSHGGNLPHNNKFFFLWGGSYEDQGAPKVGTEYLANSGGPDSNLRVMYDPAGNPVTHTVPDGSTVPTPWIGGDMVRGQWNRMRAHIDIGTTSTVLPDSNHATGDGVWEIWTNDVLSYSNSNLGLMPTNPTWPWWDTGYFFGSASYDPADEAFYIDDVKFYDSDPGW